MAKQHDIEEVPLWARPIVEDYQARQAAAEAQAAEDARLANEEAKLASRRAAKSAVHMGHMGNRPGENFRLAERRSVTRCISTPEQRHFEATRQARLKEAQHGNLVPRRPD